MRVLEVIAGGETCERRVMSRRKSNQLGILQHHLGSTESIQLVDVCEGGCGFFSRWPVPAGTRVWLRLPGLEMWKGTISWYEGGQGGMTFDRTLHPLVAARYAIDTVPPLSPVGAEPAARGGASR